MVIMTEHFHHISGVSYTEYWCVLYSVLMWLGFVTPNIIRISLKKWIFLPLWDLSWILIQDTEQYPEKILWIGHGVCPKKKWASAFHGLLTSRGVLLATVLEISPSWHCNFYFLPRKTTPNQTGTRTKPYPATPLTSLWQLLSAPLKHLHTWEMWYSLWLDAMGEWSSSHCCLAYSRHQDLSMLPALLHSSITSPFQVLPPEATATTSSSQS